jgi:asparagine synthase (glutamine-hydrolysing)
MLFELRSWLVDTYLEKVDKATMAASLEARVPLLDPRLVELMALAPRSWRVQGFTTKVLLRRIAARYVPRETVRKPKQGFHPPIGLWLDTALRERVEAICESSSRLADLVDIQTARSIVRAQRRGEWRDTQVWALLMLGVWADARTRTPSAARN